MKWPSTVSLVAEQTRYQLLLFWRSPVGMFFTLGLPIFMLVLFNSLFGEGTVETPAGSWSVQQFYTGGLAAFTAVSATYTNLVNVVPIPGSDRTDTSPPWVRATLRTMDNPRPVPPEARLRARSTR